MSEEGIFEQRERERELLRLQAGLHQNIDAESGSLEGKSDSVLCCE